MKTYEQVDTYMQQIGLKYVKSSNEFVAGLAIRTNKDYTQKVAAELNLRAQHSNSSNMVFYKIKNETFDGSIYISAAFDGGLFRHLGNLIIDNAELFDGKETVDFACDCGIVTCFIAKMYPNCHITGVDVNSSAIENANILKDKLGLDNVDFICSDVFEYNNENKADTAVTFRALLDVCMAKTKELPFFGERMWRENQYKDAFADFVNVINNNIKPDGKILSVERYTADYGWLGYMMALEDKGIHINADKSAVMRASDISSVKEYSVTFAGFNESDSAENAFDTVLSREFKAGQGYEGEMAEFALYYDSEGDINFVDIYKDDKLLHQFATAQSKKGKLISYEASGNRKKVKYLNAKKRDALEKQLADNLLLYDEKIYKITKYSK